VDEKNVYFTDEGTQGASTGQVVSFPRTAKDGSEAKILAKDLNNPRGLFVDAQGVYWVNVGSGKGVRDGSVEMLSKTTSGYGAKVTLASNLSDARELAVDETRVYWTSYQDNTISAVAKNSDGSLAPVILVQNAPGSTVVSHPLAIATDAKYIYWSNYDGTMLSTGSKGAIMRVLKN
jgi:hypothetical protein